MVSFKKKQPLEPKATVATIVLSKKASGDSQHAPPHHFLSHETIAGWAEFSAEHFSNCRITLKGLIKTTTQEPGNPKAWRTEKLPFLGVEFERQPQVLSRSKDIVRVPFKFKLSECEKLAAFVGSLPPSVNSRREGQQPTEPQYEISYNITAVAFSKRGKLATAEKKVVVTVVSPDSLSDASSDGPGEHFWAQKSISRSKSIQSTTNIPQIELAGQEPPPILLNAEDYEAFGATGVPLIVKLSPQGSDKLDKESFPANAKVKAHLVTKTTMTPDGMKGVSTLVTLGYIKIEGHMVSRQSNTHSQDHNIPITNWERSVSDDTDSFAVARFSIPFELIGGKVPISTFSTPLLSRRYFIDLTITFDGADDTFKLSVPCDIIHASEDASDYYDFYDAKEKIVDDIALAKLEKQPSADRRATVG